MTWEAVVTNKGIAMMKESLAGKVITITGAAGGTGTVPSASLMTQTDLKNKKQDLSLIGLADTDQGKKVQIQVTSVGLATGYTLNQVGVWAKIDEEDPVLMAIFQDSRGVDIPSYSDVPEFLMEFFAALEYSQYANINIVADGSAYVSSQTLQTALAAHNGNSTAHENIFSKKADLDDTGKVPASQIPALDYVPNTQKGVAGGVATLNGNGKVPIAQIPNLAYVPTTRKVNNKALSADIILNPDDIGVTAKRTCTFVIGTSTAGWTEEDCDYLCDGTADDVEINAAIQALPNYGGEILFLSGEYSCNEPINLNGKNGTRLVGESDRVRIKKTFNGSSLIDAYYASIYIECLGLSGYYDDSEGALVTVGSNSKITNCELYSAGTGIRARDNFIVANCTISCTYHAISGRSNGFIYCNNIHVDKDTAVLCYDSCVFGNLIYGSEGEKQGNGIMLITGGGDHHSEKSTCFGNIITDVNRGVLAIGDRSIVCGNNIQRCNIGIRCGDSGGTRITRGTVISSNAIFNCTEANIMLENAEKNNVIGNLLSPNSDEYTSLWTSAMKSIWLKGSTNNYNLISGNYMYGKNYTSEGGTGNTFVNNKYN